MRLEWRCAIPRRVWPSRNIERELRALAEIELSLRRIETGDYGVCGVCGEKIPLARLKAIPWTRCCVECASGSTVKRTTPERTAA